MEIAISRYFMAQLSTQRLHIYDLDTAVLLFKCAEARHSLSTVQLSTPVVSNKTQSDTQSMATTGCRWNYGFFLTSACN